jgi:hypothetical protein
LKLEESIDIRAEAAKVWSFVGDIVLWPSFVSKITKATPLPGNRFEFHHEKGPVIAELLDEKLEKEIGVNLIIKNRHAQVRYTLEEREVGLCRVTEIQDFSVPFPINLLIQWIHRTGKKTGNSNLDNLKQLVETTF